MTGPSCQFSPAHPRSRGENLNAVAGGNKETGSSPLTRGKLHDLDVCAGEERLIPAHAGKTAPRSRARVACAAHPRSRGENASAVSCTASIRGSSPLTRGKHDEAARVLQDHRLIPAHAGKTSAWT